ncbi:MAG: DUF4921 family protein [Candidatus Spechtbacterales bacterium]
MFQRPGKKNQPPDNILDTLQIPSELRRDLVTGDWIVIARARAKRPHDFTVQREKVAVDVKNDPFINPQASGNYEPVLQYTDAATGEWTLQVIPNKYPAFTSQGQCMVPRNRGPYAVIDGRGFHEVVVFKDPVRDIAHFSRDEATLVLRAFHERLRALSTEDCVQYVSIFQNHGKEAGASLAHPHAQIIALPVVPPDVHGSLRGSRKFYEKNNKTVHATIIGWEREEAKRVIYENKTMIAFCPFTSRTAFEIRIFPKAPQPRFEDVDPRLLSDVADALRASLRMLHDTLDDPAYNFFLHTAPVNHGDYRYYHWHFEILPKTIIWAGFELGTGIEISTIEPEKAAAFLREHLPSDV